MEITFTPINSEQTRILFEVQKAFERASARASRKWRELAPEALATVDYDDLEADALAGVVVLEANATISAAQEALEHARGETALVYTEGGAPLKRKRRTKAEMEAARAAEAAPVADSKDPAQLEIQAPVVEAAAPASEPAPEPVVHEKPTLETVREAMKAYAERRGSGAVGVNAARELIGTFGVTRLSDLKEKDYAAFIVAASK